MSDRTATVVGDVLRVLVVGDSPPVDAAMDALSSQFESISLVRERTLASALERLAQLEIHCAVCPHDATADPSPLERLRARDDAVPILAVVEDSSIDDGTVETALEAGATDVVEADDPRSLVATRVRNAAERRRLETASARRRQSILERSDALVWVVDESGVVEYASSAVDPRMGYTPDELERTPLSQLVHPDDRERVTETLRTVSAAAFGATERVSARLGHGDGTWHAYELTATNRLADPVVGGVVITLSRSAAADSAADAGVAAAVDRLADPVFSLGRRGELRYANEAAADLFDADAEPGTVVWDLLDDAARTAFYERIREATATDRVVSFETRYPSLGTRLAVDVHPDDDGVTVHAREASRAGVDRERFDLLESVVDRVDDGLAVVEDSTIRYANARLFELADAERLVGRELDALFDDDLAAAVRERADSPAVRWMDPVSGELAGDGRRPVDVFVSPLSAVDGTLCVVRDRRRSAAAALETVADAIDSIRDADGRTAVRRAVVDATLAATGADLVGWYLLEEDVLRPATVAAADSDAQLDPSSIDRRATDLPERLEAEPGDESGDGIVLDGSELEAAFVRSGIRAERAFAVRVADHGLVLAVSTEPMAFGSLERRPVEIVVGAAATALDGLERAVAVRSQRGELDRLESAVDRCRRLREIERTLLAGESREEIARTLCESLVSLPAPDAAGSIRFAWVGDVTTGSERITPDAWAGDGHEESLESISISMADDAAHPAGRAAATLESTIERIADGGGDGNADADREWRKLAGEAGLRAALSVPLVADEFCYGTLTVHSAQPSAFDGPMRGLCEHLAAVASHAIAALERKRALLSERVTELEVVLRNGAADEPLSAIATELDRRLDVQAVVPRSSAGATVFCTVADVDESAIRDAIDSVAAIESGRLVGARADASLVELVVAESTVAETLAEHGGVLRSVAPAEDRTRLVVDLSSTVDVGSFVRMIERTHPGAELVARRERDRSARPARAFDAELRDRLSERQLRTLETAYYGGFFEWPRESTGEEIADSLGVSQPTFSRHLRIAQRKVYALLFDERIDSGER